MSKEYDSLNNAVSDLSASLLDFAPSPIEPYSDPQLLKCQAFVVFCHAEFQVYFETVAKRVMREAELRWRGFNAIDRVIAALLAFRSPADVHVPNDPIRPTQLAQLENLIRMAIASHLKVINENNGVKRYNISELFVPLGVVSDDLDEQLLLQLDQTGRKRGDMVHKSSKVSLRTIRDPFTEELPEITQLLAEIKKFDLLLERRGLLSGGG